VLRLSRRRRCCPSMSTDDQIMPAWDEGVAAAAAAAASWTSAKDETESSESNASES